MNTKLKIALLALLGFSTASCASKKAAKRSVDKQDKNIETDAVDTRIMLMYGVPGPNDFPRLEEETEQTPMQKVEGDKPARKPIVDEENTPVPVVMYGVPYPDEQRQNPAKRDTVATSQEAIEEFVEPQIELMYGVPFPEDTPRVRDPKQEKTEMTKQSDKDTAVEDADTKL